MRQVDGRAGRQAGRQADAQADAQQGASDRASAPAAPTLYTHTFLTVTLSWPSLPAIFLPFHTRPGQFLVPMAPGARWTCSRQEQQAPGSARVQALVKWHGHQPACVASSVAILGCQAAAGGVAASRPAGCPLAVGALHAAAPCSTEPAWCPALQPVHMPLQQPCMCSHLGGTMAGGPSCKAPALHDTLEALAFAHACHVHMLACGRWQGRWVSWHELAGHELAGYARKGCWSDVAWCLGCVVCGCCAVRVH
jgi:hypothetical protein